MPDRSRKKERDEDVNEAAARIVRQASDETGGKVYDEEALRREAARILGRQGGLKGGPARAESLTAEERSEIARKAAKTRWQREKEEE
jgi:hypothetical protein